MPPVRSAPVDFPSARSCPAPDPQPADDPDHGPRRGSIAMLGRAVLMLAILVAAPSTASAGPSMIVVGPTVTIGPTGHVLVDVAYQCSAGSRAFLSATVSEAVRPNRNYTFGHSPAGPAYACDGDYRTVTLVAPPEDGQAFVPGQGRVNADVSFCDRQFDCEYGGQTTRGGTLGQGRESRGNRPPAPSPAGTLSARFH